MKIKELIKKSIYKEGKPSSSRILAFSMMIIIFLFGFTSIFIEIVNAAKTWSKGESYIIPWEHITILGMWLAHQLTLLRIYKGSEKNSALPSMEKITTDNNTSTSTKDSTEE